MPPRRLTPLCFALLSCCWVCSCATRAPAPQRFEFARAAMGTEFRLVLYAEDAPHAEGAAEAAFARILELDRTLSDYDPESELSLLGAGSDGPTQGEWLPVSADLGAVLAVAIELAHESAGAFDVTAGPYTHLWRRARRRQELPDPARLAAAAPSVGFEKLELDPAAMRVRLRARGMRLDVGGIGKGYALDQALATLEAHGILRALVVGGGEMRAGDPPPGARGWRVELVGLAEAGRESAPEFLELAHAALATSGDLEQVLVLDGTRHSHILDPRSGAALTEQRLVSVIGPSATWTDALATTLSVLAPESAANFLRRHPGYEARIQVRRARRIEVLRTAAFPSGLSCPAALVPSP